MSPGKIVLHLLSIEILGWHVIIWDGSQVKAFPNPDHPPLAIFLTYQAFCTGMKILHLILLRFVKLESEISLLI